MDPYKDRSHGAAEDDHTNDPTVTVYAWPDEETYLDEDDEEWSTSFAAYMYLEHVLDSLADWHADRDGLYEPFYYSDRYPELSSRYYRPVPLTFCWRRIGEGGG
jgi:hypothetical protein